MVAVSITPSDLISRLQTLLGTHHVKTTTQATHHYVTGWRSGGGRALAVVFPQTLWQLWQVLEVCVAADCIIIMQAANTGLTEGSVPNGDDYDRPVLVINTLAMNKLILLGKAEQVISFAGATLHQLEHCLKPHKRAPHSVIGSSCLGASIIGGIANNSGGALVKRGPAYTELALFASVDADNQLHLVNHLGIDLGNTPEEILTNLEQENFVLDDVATDKRASASDYAHRIRDIESNLPSRFNADPSRLFEASGCAGKLAVFAVRLDTFAIPAREQTFYIGTNQPDVLQALRRHILSDFTHLPEVGEYLHRDMFTIAEQYGKDTFLSIYYLGTERLPRLFALKGRIDAWLDKLPVPAQLTDKLMQGLSRLLPAHLPPRLKYMQQTYEHHLIVTMSDAGIEEGQDFLVDFFKTRPEAGEVLICSEEETQKAFLHRFAAAGAAMRYQVMQQPKVGEMLSLDIALRSNDQDWVETLPPQLAEQIDKQLYYGHFFCHVFHQDYVLKAGVDAEAVKAQMLALLDARGAKYPAEHNVGHLYAAEPSLTDFYQQLDPTNRFNPGIGKTSKYKRNCACC